MKLLLSDLSNAGLEYFIAQCEGMKFLNPRPCLEDIHFPLSRPDWETLGNAILTPDAKWHNVPNYVTDWSAAGPIIEREVIELSHLYGQWCGTIVGEDNELTKVVAYGETPLIAAMRCYLRSKLGDFCTIPKKLSNLFVG